MKKFCKYVLVAMIAVIIASVLFGCTPTGSGGGNNNGGGNSSTGRKDYGVTALKDLTDYSAASFSATGYASNLDTVADEIADLESKIVSLNDEYHDCTLNTLQKILKNSDASAIIAELGNSGLKKEKMTKLVSYVAGNKADGGHYTLAEAKATTEATGLIEDYSAILEWDDELEEEKSAHGTDSDAYKTLYKQRYMKSWSMNETLYNTGMDGGDAARALVYVMNYIQTVVKSEKMGADTDITEYFKDTLFTRVYELTDVIGEDSKYEYDSLSYSYDSSAYEVLIAIRAYNGVRWSKDQTDAVTTGSSDKKNQLIKGWGYSYDYEMGTHKALTKEEYEKNIDYSLKSYLSNDEAIEAAKIERKLYASGYRYSAEFYKKYYSAIKTYAQKEELHEARVYGFVTDGTSSSATGSNNNKITVESAGNSVSAAFRTEPIIEVNMGKIEDSYVEQLGKGINAGMESFLLSSDMEYYYSKDDKHVTVQAEATKKMSQAPSDSATYYNAQFDLEIANLKSSDFVMTEFLLNSTGNTELQQLLRYQIYNYQSDYIRSAKRLKASIYRSLAELVKEGVYEVSADGKAYTLVNADGWEEDIYNVGRDNASLNALYTCYEEFELDTQLDLAGNASFKDSNNTQGISGNVKSVLEQESSIKTSHNGSARLTALKDALIKRVYVGKSGTKYTISEAEDPNAPASIIEDIAGKEPEYDTDWALSRLFLNHEEVVYYTAGQVRVEFRMLNEGGNSDQYNKGNDDTTASYDESLGGGFLPDRDEISSVVKDVKVGEKTFTSNYKWYLKQDYDSSTGELNYYYEVTSDTSLKYDSRLYLGHVAA